MRAVVGQLDVAGSAVTRRLALVLLAALSMAHVGSPDTFFAGKAGPYGVRVSVRLPGVIPGRAQVVVRVAGAAATTHRVTVRAGQWNVGMKGAPPPEQAAPVPGDPTLFAAELWFMTASSYQLGVAVEGPSGHGDVVIPVLALATAQRTMAPWLGTLLAALGLFLTLGLLTIIASALRESELPPGVEPDRAARRRARIGVAVTAVLAVLILLGGNRWWNAEASSYAQFVLYRPFAAQASVSTRAPDRQTLTMSIRDPRWVGRPNAASRYNALLPDHGRLMHLFLVREPALDAFAHLHPIARTTQALDFDAVLPPLPAGRYRAYGDIVHESGYAQTLVAAVDVPESRGPATAASDPDDSSFVGDPRTSVSAAFHLGDGSRLMWASGDQPPVAGQEFELAFSVRDAAGRPVTVEPYMGMAAHVVVVSRDGSVCAHLHPAGSISMAALQKFAGSSEGADMSMPPSDPHAGHTMSLPGDVSIPYAFPKAGDYRVWVQVKRGGEIHTAAFDAQVR